MQSAASSKKMLSFFTAFALVFSVVPLIVFPLAGAAQAQETRQYEVDVFVGGADETDSNQTGDTVTLSATVTDGPQSGAATTAGVEVDFEIDCLNGCAGATYQVVTGSTGTTSPIDTPTDGDQSAGAVDDTRTTPELSCTTGTEAGQNTCTVSYIRNNPGNDLVAGFVDDDKANGNNDSTDSDATEGRNETTAPGSVTEPDDTDVVEKEWVAALPGDDITLDCDDDGDAGDNANLESHPAPERALNPPNESEVYTCAVWNDNGQGDGVAENGVQEGGEQSISGMRVDAENLGGANDPDTTGQPGGDPDSPDPGTPPNATTADYNDACTTDASGRCTFTLTASEGELGFAHVCFWTDEDNDGVYDEDTTENDGGECDGDESGEGGGGTNDNGDEDWNEFEACCFSTEGDSTDRSDVVRKEWTSPGTARFLNLEPENDANLAGSSHSVTATVLDPFGTPVAGTPVDFRIDPDFGSRNEARNSANGVICDNVATNASGQATCTYQDIGQNPATTPPGVPITPGDDEEDRIDACIADPNDPGFECVETDEGSGDDDGFEPEFNDQADEVAKFWFSSIPQTDEVILDMCWLSEDFGGSDCEPSGNSSEGPGTENCGEGSRAEDSDTNIVGTTHTVCASIEDVNDAEIEGKPVTFTITSGPGQWFVDEDGDGEFDEGEGVGSTITVNADNNGDARASMYSEEVGTSSVTASSDGESDSGIKIWNASSARIIDCEPETASNQTGTTHTVPCLVTDRFANPRPGTLLAATEDGVGQLICPTPLETFPYYGESSQVCFLTTDANGTAQIQATSATEGAQTYDVGIASDAITTDPTDRGNQGSTPQDFDNTCDQTQGNLSFTEGDDSNNDQDNDPDAPLGVCFDETSKTWTAEQQPECSDGVDNDGDGEIDFPNDPGCDSADDNDESNPPVVQRGRCEGRFQGSRTDLPGGGQMIVGTNGADTLIGTGGPDIICALAGNDTIRGRGSRDLIFAGRGNDTANGGGGNDRIRGGGGRDTLRGNRGRDTLLGGGRRDRLVGGRGNDTLRGNRGNDVLRGGRGNDFLHGGSGRDRCIGGPGRDRFRSCERRRQ